MILYKVICRIVHKDNKWCVVSSDGTRSFGCYTSRKQAEKRLRQIEYFKQKENAMDKSLEDVMENLGTKVAATDLKPTNVDRPKNGPGQNTPDLMKYNKPFSVNLETDPAGGRSKPDLVGTVAGKTSSLVNDRRDHFPITNEGEAHSAIKRIMSLRIVPDWFMGSLSDLQKLVHASVTEKYPKLQITVAMDLEKVFAGITLKDIKNPADANDKAVPEVPTPNLQNTGNENDSKQI